MFKNKKNFWLLAVILVCFLLFHGSSFDNFFSQDDFYHLALAKIDRPLDFLNFFNPWQQTDPHFRPLGTQVFFSLAFIFPPDLAPLILRLIAAGFHLANFYLVFLILNKVLKKETLSLALAGVYLLAPLHFLSLYYLSAFQQILAAFWQFLAFYSFAQGKKKRVYFYFFLAILSKETALIFPLLLLIFSYIIRPEKKIADGWQRFKSEFFYWLSFLGLVLPYGLVRFFTFTGLSNEGYQLSLSPRTFLGSWRWYLTWLMGVPETAINYTGRIFDFHLDLFLKDSGFLGRTLLAALLAELAITCLIWLISQKKKETKFDFWPTLMPLVLFGGFFIVSLLPVTPFPYHRYSHYLDLALFGLLLTVGSYFVRRRQPIVLWVLLAIVFLVISDTSLAIDRQFHWTTARSAIAEEAFHVFQANNLCQEEALYFIDSDLPAQEVNIALFNNWGPEYFCHYQAPPVYYQGVNPPDLEAEFVTVTIN
jgi:hypothetical protein